MTQQQQLKKPPVFDSKPVRRAVQFGLRGVDTATRSVELAFASEDPYERWYGFEILDCSPGSVDLTRLRQAGPLLMGHDPDDQIGVVESVSVDADRVCRAVVRFSQSVRGQEIYQDVIDGIRRSVSVGYVVQQMQSEPEIDGTDAYRAVRWQPFEVSLVSVPADITVGVGRASAVSNGPDLGVLDQNAAAGGPVTDPETDPDNDGDNDSSPAADPDQDSSSTGNDGQVIVTTTTTTVVQIPIGETEMAENQQQQQERGPDVASIENAFREREQTRMNEIRALGEKFAHLGGRDLALEHIAAGRSAADMQLALLERTPTPQKRGVGDEPARIGMNEKEVKSYSFVRLINALANPNDQRAQKAAAFELECHRAAEEKRDSAARGLLVPFDVLTGAAERNLSVGTATAGGNLVPTNLLAQNFIELLRNALVLPSMGAQMLTGLQGNIAIPRMTAAATAYWVNEGSAPTESDQAFDQVSMTPKTIGAFTDISRKLIMQSSLDIENLVRQDLATIIGLGIQQVAINGSGSAPTPRGILNTSGIGSVALGTNGLAPTFLNAAVPLETAVKVANAPPNALGYLTNAKVRGLFRSTFQNPTYGETKIWSDSNEINGYPAYMSNAVPSTLTKGTGTNLSAIIFGAWSELLIGMWSGLDLMVDPYSNSTTGTIRIVALQDVDVAVRHAPSFSAVVDAIA